MNEYQLIIVHQYQKDPKDFDTGYIGIGNNRIEAISAFISIVEGHITHHHIGNCPPIQCVYIAYKAHCEDDDNFYLCVMSNYSFN